MRTTDTGDLVIESTADDLGDCVKDFDDVYASIFQDMKTGSTNYDNYYFEIRPNGGGDMLCCSDPIFTAQSEVRRYLSNFMPHSDMQWPG